MSGRACVCGHSRGEHRNGVVCLLCACLRFEKHRPPVVDEAGQFSMFEAQAHARARVFDAIVAARGGLTFEGVARSTGMNVNTVRGRLSELAAEGVIREHPWRKRRTSNGRLAVVYLVPPLAPPAPVADVVEPPLHDDLTLYFEGMGEKVTG